MSETAAVLFEPIVEKRDKGLEAYETVHEEVTKTDTDKVEPVPENVELMPSSGDDIIVFARTPLEMARAQSALTAWAVRRINKAEEELRNATDNYEAAKEAKIRTAGWKSQIRKYEKELRFYVKIHAALEEGYFIVPDFPMNIIAVRTTQDTPMDTAEYQHRGSVDSEQHEELEIGEGDYKDSQVPMRKIKTHIEKEGKLVPVDRWTADGLTLQKMDFPFRMIKPHLLKDLKKAADHRIFDAIGVVPGQRKSRDPMLLGVIENKVGKHQVKRMVFLISWWVPTADL